MKPQSFQQCIDRYGQPWASPEDQRAFECKWMGVWSCYNWEKDTGKKWILPFGRIYCNIDIIPLLDATFSKLADEELIHEIKTFDGCFNIRRKRGNDGEWSLHSFGIAIDFNAALMPFGSESQWSTQFLQTMDGLGWTLGAEFSPTKDPMHFQYADNC